VPYLAGILYKLDRPMNGRSIYRMYNGFYLAWIKFGFWAFTQDPFIDQPLLNAMNTNNYFCAEDITAGWLLYTPTGTVPGLPAQARCSNCLRYPKYPECASCCNEVTVQSLNKDISGDYKLYTAMPEFNGKPVYASISKPYCLKTSPLYKNWIIGLCVNLTTAEEAFAFGNLEKCPRQTVAWSLPQNGTLVPDPTFKITCTNGTQCVPCRTVLDGEQAEMGQYTFKRGNETGCGDGCVYEKAGQEGEYCFPPGPLRVEQSCP